VVLDRHPDSDPLFLCRPDPHPDLIVTKTDPAPDPSIIKQKYLLKNMNSSVLDFI
jgi:hypothetical protein